MLGTTDTVKHMSDSATQRYFTLNKQQSNKMQVRNA